MTLDAGLGCDDDHLAGFDLADELGADDVERAGFRCQSPALADLTQHQRAHAKRVAHTDQLGARHRDDRERAFDTPQRVLHPLRDRLLQAARHQVDDALAVRRRLEDRAAVDHLAAQLGSVDDVAVVRNRRAAHRKLAEEWLHVADRGVALRSGRGVADVPDGDRPRQGLHQGRVREAVAHVPEPPGRVEALVRIVADDTRRLLAAVLQRMEAKRREVRRLGDADHAEDAALFAQLVVVEGMCLRQGAHGPDREVAGSGVT